MGESKPKPKRPEGGTTQVDRLSIKRSWEKAVQTAVTKKRPAEGWPERVVKKRKRKPKSK